MSESVWAAEFNNPGFLGGILYLSANSVGVMVVAANNPSLWVSGRFAGREDELPAQLRAFTGILSRQRIGHPGRANPILPVLFVITGGQVDLDLQAVI